MPQTVRNHEQQVTQHTVKFFEALLRATRDGIVITDTSQHIIFVNEPFCAIFGMSRQELIETSLFLWLERFDHTARQRWCEMENRAWQEGTCLEVEFEMASTQGTRHFSVNASCLEREPDEQGVGIISTWRDISDRKRAEVQLQSAHDALEERVLERTKQLDDANRKLHRELDLRRQEEQAREELFTELQASEEKYRTVVDSAPESIVIVDLSGRIRSCNRETEKLTGYKREELEGKSLYDLQLLDPMVASHLKRRFSSLLDGQTVEANEMQIKPKRGSNRWVGVRSKLVHSQTQTEGVLLITRDMTSQKHAEQQLKQGREQLEELVERRTAELQQEIEERKYLERRILEISEREQVRIAQALHDNLGQHLTGVTLMSKALEQKLRQKSLSEADQVVEIRRLVNEALFEAKHLARTLLPAGLKDHGLQTALKELTINMQKQSGVSCQFKCDSTAISHSNTVAAQLYQIAKEAVHNAIIHGQANHVLIHLACANSRMKLVVEDDGVGFPVKQKEASGLGIHLMNYRARMINAAIDIRQGVTGGAVVTCSLDEKNKDAGDTHRGQGQ